MANIVAGAIVIGFSLGEPRVSWLCFSRPGPSGAACSCLRSSLRKARVVTNAILFFALLAAVVGVITLLDWLGGRRERKSQHGHV